MSFADLMAQHKKNQGQNSSRQWYEDLKKHLEIGRLPSFLSTKPTRELAPSEKAYKNASHPQTKSKEQDSAITHSLSPIKNTYSLEKKYGDKKEDREEKTTYRGFTLTKMKSFSSLTAKQSNQAYISKTVQDIKVSKVKPWIIFTTEGEEHYSSLCKAINDRLTPCQLRTYCQESIENIQEATFFFSASLKGKIPYHELPDLSLDSPDKLSPYYILPILAKLTAKEKLSLWNRLKVLHQLHTRQRA